jgi:hypothetical protein
MFMQKWCQIFRSLVFTYTKVQVPLFGMKYGGIGPLKLLFCTNLFHIVESSMSQLVWSFSTLLDFFYPNVKELKLFHDVFIIFGLCNFMIMTHMKWKNKHISI